MPLKTVFFDLVGTLVHPRGSIGSQYAAVATRHGAKVDPDALEAAFAREIRSTPPLRQRAGATAGEAAASEREWWRKLVRRVFAAAGGETPMRPGSFEPFFEELFRRFTTAAAWQLYPDVLPTLDDLSARGLSIGLITNYDSRIYPLVESLGLAPRIGSITIPGNAGEQKPSPGIFARALAVNGLAPDEAGHVGDSLPEDYEGAKGAGMRAVLLDREGEHEDLAGIPRAATLDAAVRLLS